MEYFSEREQNSPLVRNIDKITSEVWWGIRAIIKRCIANNGLANDFPMSDSYDNNVYGCDENKLDDEIRATIPRIKSLDSFELPTPQEKSPWDTSEEEQQPINDMEGTYDVLDLIEFIYSHLCDFKKLEYNESLHRHRLEFVDGITQKNAFRGEINDIFRRNHLVYELSTNGQIRRIVPVSLAEPLKTMHNTKDAELNNMLDIAVDSFLSPKIEDRRLGLEKLWDAFERLKTIECSSNKQEEKSKSADKILTQMGNDSKEFTDLLQTEAKALTGIGNDFQIRHFETNKIKIEDSAHVDYLFFRMMALINLFLDKYNQIPGK